MPLDSDVMNGDEQLHVEFYIAKDIDPKWDGKPFVRIQVPGDKNNIMEQPVREDHKQRFPRQWLYFQVKQSENSTPEAIGTPLSKWHEDAKQDINKAQIEELQIARFQTVEQVAGASDAQMQKFGMGGIGLRERAKTYLARKHRSETSEELESTKRQLAELQAQMSALMADKPRRGRPPKELQEA
jgi:hypothetical protein